MWGVCAKCYFIRAIYTYVVLCKGQLSAQQKQELTSYLQDLTAKSGGDQTLADQWSMTVDEVRKFKELLQS